MATARRARGWIWSIRSVHRRDPEAIGRTNEALLAVHRRREGSRNGIPHRLDLRSHRHRRAAPAGRRLRLGAEPLTTMLKAADLRAARAAMAVMIRESAVRYVDGPLTLDGRTPGPGCWIASADGYLIEDGATAIAYRRGEGISVHRGPGHDSCAEELFRQGSVYTAIAALNGFLPIHASAVTIRGEVHALSGPSGAGKSTLVAALATLGAALFCDDTLVLVPGEGGALIALPGHKRLKLTADALTATGLSREGQVYPGVSKWYARPPGGSTVHPLPLASLTFLEDGPLAFSALRGSEALSRLYDGHYTAQITDYVAADPTVALRHRAALVKAAQMFRFVRPRNEKGSIDWARLLLERLASQV